MKTWTSFLCCCFCLQTVCGQVVSTFAGSGIIGSTDATGSAASFWYPSGVCFDNLGNLFATDQYNHTIRKITSSGVVTTFAGSGTSGSVDGLGTAASFSRPFAICCDNSGNLYIGEVGNQKIRKITPLGLVSTLAGSGAGGAADGTGSLASFNYPNGICVDLSGNLYVADYFNNKIRKITSTGVVTTFAGSGSLGATDATSLAATFNGPSGICWDQLGNLVVTEYGNNKIRKISPLGVVTTFAGSGAVGATDATGTSATFNGPGGICSDAGGNLYISDTYNNKIRKINPGAVVTTSAGLTVGGMADGTVTIAKFDRPVGIVEDGSGNLFVADVNNHKIRRVGACTNPTPPAGITQFFLEQICTGMTTTLTAAGSGTVTWFNFASGGSPIGTGQNIAFSNTLAAGIYTVYAEASNCPGYTSPTRTPITLSVVPMPTLTVASGTICLGMSFTIVASGALTLTPLSSGPTSTPLAGPVLTPTTTQIFTVRGINGFNCISYKTGTVTVIPALTITVNSGSICAGSAFTITPGGASSYTYSTGSNVISPATSTSYSVNGSNAFGCMGSNAFGTASVYPGPTISVNSGYICAGETFTILPVGATGYTYSGGPIVSAPVTTSYTVSGQNSFGCLGIAISTVTVLPKPTLSVTGNPATICAGETLTITVTGANSYTWNSGSTIPTAVISPTSTTLYNITGMGLNGCINTTSINISVYNCLGIERLMSDAEKNPFAYPNPNAGEFKLELGDYAAEMVELIDATGRLILRPDLDINTIDFDLGDISKGVYLLKITRVGEVKTIRIIIK